MDHEQPLTSPQEPAAALHALLDPDTGTLTGLTRILDAGARAITQLPADEPGVDKAAEQLGYARDDLAALGLHLATAADALARHSTSASAANGGGRR